MGQALEEAWPVGLGWRRGWPWKGEDSFFSEPGGKVKRAVKMEVLGVESREVNNKVIAVK